MLCDFFINEMYMMIENEQYVLMEYCLLGLIEWCYYSEEVMVLIIVCFVQYVFLFENEDVFLDRDLSIFLFLFIYKVYKLVDKQEDKKKWYSVDVNGEKVFFVIKKGFFVNG